MDIRLYCTNCNYQWLKVKLVFTSYEDANAPTRSASLSLPVTPCVECGAMQWQMLLSEPIERVSEEDMMERAKKQLRYNSSRGFGPALVGITKQTHRGSAVAPSTLPWWVTRSREAEDNNLW